MNTYLSYGNTNHLIINTLEGMAYFLCLPYATKIMIISS